MTILLTIDGVLITTPPEQIPVLLPDGFPEFNPVAAANLQKLISETNAAVVFTTMQRIEYKLEEWKTIFEKRGVTTISNLSFINDRSTVSVMPERKVEVEEWVAKYGSEDAYVIIEDDTSLNDLPDDIKSHWVMIDSMLGLDDEATAQALHLLKSGPAT